MQYFARVLLAAGVSNDLDALVRYCDGTIRPDASRLWVSAVDFAQSLREKVFSTDYFVLMGYYMTEYNGTTMKSRGVVPESFTRVLGRKILCTTELGLCRRTKLRGEGDADGSVKMDVVQKATIVYEWEIDAQLGR